MIRSAARRAIAWARNAARHITDPTAAADATVDHLAASLIASAITAGLTVCRRHPSPATTTVTVGGHLLATVLGSLDIAGWCPA